MPRNRLEKIPIPPIPAFLRSASRAPEKKAIEDLKATRRSGDDRLAEIISRNAISDEEADLLLGLGAPAEVERPGHAPEDPGLAGRVAPGATSLPEGSVTEDETEDLIGLAPGPVILPTAPAPGSPRRDMTVSAERSGESGAAVLNELVDEIEKDIERGLERQSPAGRIRRYGRTIGCWVSPLAGPSDPVPHSSAPRKREKEETS